MKCLVVESSGEVPELSVVEFSHGTAGGGPVDPTHATATVTRRGAGARSHAEEFPSLYRSLGSAGVLENVTLVVFGAGPGSFTGLRIGECFASGLADGLGVPLRSASTFLAAAWPHAARGRVVVVRPAGPRTDYVGVYGPAPDGAAPVAPLRAVPKGAWRSAADEASGGASLGPPPGGVTVVTADPERDAGFLPFAASPGVLALLASGDTHGKAGALPDYVRAVEAKTIAERRAAPAGVVTR